MKIAIEAQRIFRPNKHGMDFVALETIRELQKMDHENEYFIFVSPGEDKCLKSSENMHVIELKCPTYPLWEQVALPRAVKRIRPDLLHCTSNTAPLNCPVPLVLTLHDIIYLEKRQSSSLSLYQEMGWHYRRLVVPRILPKARKSLQFPGLNVSVSSMRCTCPTNSWLPYTTDSTAISIFSPKLRKSPGSISVRTNISFSWEIPIRRRTRREC